METCAQCSQPTVTGHTLALDGARRVWRLCCLCMAELIAVLDKAKADA